jgi:D-tyrosyl-tRNA(Tyr) deacylase
MRAILQRVSAARVEVAGRHISQIEAGWLVLLGVGAGDSAADASYLAEKTAYLRAFSDDDGKMNRSVLETGGEILVVSQFTLYGDCRKGRRPGFSNAAPPAQAEELYQTYVAALKGFGLEVRTGQFQTHMLVSLTNDGPVTFLLDSGKQF